MPHISYSELKDWKFCAHYHKLTRVDGIDGFTGNQYTAFGSAIHSVCEKKLLNEELAENFFTEELGETVKSTFLDLLRKKDFNEFVLTQWSNLENWGPAQLADGHWFGYGKKIIIDADTGKIYKPNMKVSKLRKR